MQAAERVGDVQRARRGVDHGRARDAEAVRDLRARVVDEPPEVDAPAHVAVRRQGVHEPDAVPTYRVRSPSRGTLRATSGWVVTVPGSGTNQDAFRRHRRGGRRARATTPTAERQPSRHPACLATLCCKAAVGRAAAARATTRTASAGGRGAESGDHLLAVDGAASPPDPGHQVDVPLVDARRLEPSQLLDVLLGRAEHAEALARSRRSPARRALAPMRLCSE